MTSIDTAGPKFLNPRSQRQLVSLRERFEVVRRGEIQRACGRLGSLSQTKERYRFA